MGVRIEFPILIELLACVLCIENRDSWWEVFLNVDLWFVISSHGMELERENKRNLKVS